MPTIKREALAIMFLSVVIAVLACCPAALPVPECAAKTLGNVNEIVIDNLRQGDAVYVLLPAGSLDGAERPFFETEVSICLSGKDRYRGDPEDQKAGDCAVDGVEYIAMPILCDGPSLDFSVGYSHNPQWTRETVLLICADDGTAAAASFRDADYDMKGHEDYARFVIDRERLGFQPYDGAFPDGIQSSAARQDPSPPDPRAEAYVCGEVAMVIILIWVGYMLYRMNCKPRRPAG